MFKYTRASITRSTDSKTTFNTVTKGCTRRTAARAFYELASLAYNRFLNVRQEIPYGDISIALSDSGKSAKL